MEGSPESPAFISTQPGAVPDYGQLYASMPVTMDDLVEIKHASDDYRLYPNHGFAKGGVGHLIATGGARSGLNRLPQVARRSARGGLRSFSAAPSSRSAPISTYTVSRGQPVPTLHLQTSSTGSGGAKYAPDAETLHTGTFISQPASARTSAAAKPWEKNVPHASDFVTTTRSSRIYDVPSASKWSGLSFYENNPEEIKRHLDIINALDQLHTTNKMEERQAERNKHQAWATQQREIFRRQRRELANKYQQMGLSPRPSYAWAASSDYMPFNSEGSWEGSIRPSTVGTSTGDAGFTVGLPPSAFTDSRAVTAEEGAPRPWSAFSEGYLPGATSFSQSQQVGISEQPRPIALPKPTYSKIYDRIGAEIADSPRLVTETWRRKNECIRAQKEEQVIKSELAELDGFEDHLAFIKRQKARSQYAQAAH